MKIKSIAFKKLTALSLLPFLILGGCARSKKTLSEERELTDAEIGKQFHEKVLATFYLYTETSLVTYLNRVGSSVAANSETPGPYQITVILSEKIFAMSAPGGYHYISTGMLNFVENEAELAAVLAHEIAQLEYKPPKHNGNTRRVAEAIGIGGMMVGGIFAPIGMLSAVGANALWGDKTREELTQMADKKCLSYLISTGYDPQSWMDVTARLLKLKEKSVYYIFDYHTSRPLSPERMNALRLEFSKLDLKGKELDTKTKEFLDATKGVREILPSG